MASQNVPQLITRFAPSPTGLLHRGHAYAAIAAHDLAGNHGGQFLVRLEDIDNTRCRSEFEQSIFDDLSWLGLTWKQPVRRQSEHLNEYRLAVDILQKRGLLFPCFCTRRDIQEEIQRAGGAPQGEEGPLYPGICRRLSVDEQQQRMNSGEPYALRLDLQLAMTLAEREVGRHGLTWHDRNRGTQTAQPQHFGDVVLVRKDIGCSYHLAVVLDDALQQVSLVTRGSDLFEATHLHRLLQHLLSLPVPEYLHHRLILDDQGRRLAKRDRSETLQSLRERGITPQQIRESLADSLTADGIFLI